MTLKLSELMGHPVVGKILISQYFYNEIMSCLNKQMKRNKKSLLQYFIIKCQIRNMGGNLSFRINGILSTDYKVFFRIFDISKPLNKCILSMCFDTRYLFRSRDTNNFIYERVCSLFYKSNGTVYA